MTIIPRSRVAALVASWLALAHVFTAAAGDELLLPPAEPFPIVAWYGPPEAETTLERYRELANAGFTHNLSFLKHADAVAKALDIAHEAGVRQIVACNELLGAQAGGTVARFKQHPALFAYHLRDEPGAGEFAALADQLRLIRAVDDVHPCYINLFPNYATAGSDGQLGTYTYPEYVARFLREVPVAFVSFDHYPIVRDGSDSTAGQRAVVRPEWFANLHMTTTAARKAGKPVWAFALTVPHGPYPSPTPAQLRLQVFVNLAYGVQAIQYFTYWTPTEIEFDFHDAPIAADGTRTATYELIREINREVQALRGVFLGAKVLSVGHTGGPLPDGTIPFQPVSPIRQVKTAGSGAVVSRLANGNRQFLVIVNRDILQPLPVEVEWEAGATVQQVAKDGSLQALSDRRVQAEIEPGGLRVLTWVDSTLGR
jgi:hypothetical protein